LAAKDQAFVGKAEEYRARVQTLYMLLKGLGMDADRILAEASDSLSRED
jgi:hypothetical protein